ncbi:MAG: TetR/AcrR family transcriptional regulator [Candidatus Limnocylindrales bacterium]
MARSVDPVAHAVRRDAYVEEAIRLIQTRGYEQLSIQDVIDGAGTSKGAFFHYFNSKGALLAAVIDRMVQTAASIVAPVAADPGLSAVQKLQGLFSGIARWKGEQPELQPAAVEALMRTWYSDENSIVVERMRAAVGQRLTPLLLEILRQGAADGEFSLASPEGTASVFTSLMLGLNDEAIRLFLGRRDGTVPLERVTCTLKAYADAFERILGLPPMSWPIVDQATVTYWFA